MRNQSLNIIHGELFANMCDYSLGDQAGLHNHFPNHHFEEASAENRKLIEFLELVSSQPNEYRIVTIFIDTIRLAGLIPLNYKQADYQYLEKLVERNNLFKVIERFPRIKFIIFCHLEDTEIDSRVIPLIPKNVIAIHSTHAFATDSRIHVLPNGVQRPKTAQGHRDLEKYIGKRRKDYFRQGRTLFGYPQSIYVNINTNTNLKRLELVSFFRSKKWAKVENRVTYRKYLKRLHSFPFTLAPRGMALGDTHREWEALYIGSVPVIESTTYLQKLYKGIPVLFVEDFRELTKEHLQKEIHLVEQLRNLDLRTLDASRIFTNALISSLNEKTTSSPGSI